MPILNCLGINTNEDCLLKYTISGKSQKKLNTEI